jgi:stage V sporulation protein D (sporulation-specific penicillin-binding protein)
MKSTDRTKRARFVGLFFLTFFLFVALSVRLVKLQYHQHDKFLDIASGQHKGWIEINALRGAIYDRNGVNLASSMALPSVAVNPKKIVDPEKTAYLLSIAMGRKKSDVARLLKVPSTFVWVERKADPARAERVKKLKLPGVLVIEEPTGKRFYPQKGLACHVLGYTGIDDQGLEGVEASYDLVLRGKAGHLCAEMDQSGRILPEGQVEFVPPLPGRDIYLTIDQTVQFIAQRELEETVKKYNAAGGTVLVYEPKTGDILALASYPGFDPSDPSTYSMNRIRNRAVCDSYEPGSTFKVILAAAALDSGKVTVKDEFYSGKSLEVGGYSLRNADDGLYSPTGYETVEGIITYSFNTGAATVGLRIGTKVLSSYVEKFGFGRLTGLDLSGETEGILTPGKYWKPINLATISYGQGIAVTPIQMVQAFGAIANEGTMMKPRLVRKIMDSNGKSLRDVQPQVVSQVLNPETSHHMLKILENVCKNGTGKKANIPGYPVGGKTGTANMVVNGAYASDRYIASFVGMVPADDPRLVMLIKIDEPKGVIWGGAVAAPVFNKVGSQILWKLGIKPRLTPLAASDLKPNSRPEENN